ncbi:MAG: hypothetical protein VKI83_05450 [Synechococcaceae cyanobacterium]|nr:hypothetical protein [Synechococcaceae cyanobacterium]
MATLHNWLVKQRRRKLAYQPSFRRLQMSVTGLGALLALPELPCAWSEMVLLVLIAAVFSRWVEGALPYPHH